MRHPMPLDPIRFHWCGVNRDWIWTRMWNQGLLGWVGGYMVLVQQLYLDLYLHYLF